MESRSRADCDRYGLFPLYYFSTPQRFAISPSIPALLALGPPLDWMTRRWRSFLRLGFFLGEGHAVSIDPRLASRWHDRVECWAASGSGGLPPRRMQPLSATRRSTVSSSSSGPPWTRRERLTRRDCGSLERRA
jgi:hypothetical protein